MTDVDRFDILFRDDHFLAIDKPAGIHVHPTRLSSGETTCLTILEAQTGERLFPLHRLDRATSGVLLFGRTREAAREGATAFADRRMYKRYLAVVRGWLDDAGCIERAIRERPGKEPAEAVTDYTCLARVELPHAVGPFPTTRYSLAEALPQTGRKHQIRRHFAHISHPIIGDVNHGDGAHNRFFRERFGIQRLLLMAERLAFHHPFTDARVDIAAPLPADVAGLFAELGWGDAPESFRDSGRR